MFPSILALRSQAQQQLGNLEAGNAQRTYEDFRKRRGERELRMANPQYGPGSREYFTRLDDENDEAFLRSWLQTGAGPRTRHSYRGTEFAERPEPPATGLSDEAVLAQFNPALAALRRNRVWTVDRPFGF